MRWFVCVALVVFLGCKKDEAPARAGDPASGGSAAPAAAGGGAERSVGAYDAVVVTGSFDVTITPGTGPIRIDAPADWVDRVETVVRGSRLEIGFDRSVQNAPHISLTVPGEGVKALELTGSGTIAAKTPLKGPAVALTITGSGDIDAPVEAERAALTISGSGDIVATGTAATLEAKVAGSGDLDARALEAKAGDVTVSGSGSADVKVTGDLTCRLTGSGDLRYHGEPASKQCSATGSGTISQGS